MSAVVGADRIRGSFPIFAGTVGLQMVLSLAGFLRFGSSLYVALWTFYLVGLLAKGLEFAPFSSPDVFGHHEWLHAITLTANILGLFVDVATQ